MTQEEKILKENIMMRVRFIYGVKSLPRVFVPKLALLATLVAMAGFFISVPNVLHNMPSLFEVGNLIRFFVVAFLNTKIAIQVIGFGTLAVVFFLVRDVTRALREVHVFQTA